MQSKNYPINLYWEFMHPSMDVPVDLCETMEAMLSILSEDAQRILKAYYAEGLSVTKIAENEGLTTECVQESMQKSLCILDDPKNYEVLRLGLMETKLQKYKTYIGELEDIIKRQKEVLQQLSPTEAIEAINSKVAHILLEDLALSVRSYNVLKRAGFNTIGDVSKLYVQDLMKVRNIGSRSCNEIIDLLHTKYKIDLPDKLDFFIDAMGLSECARNALWDAGFRTARDVSKVYFEDLCDYYCLESTVRCEVFQKLIDEFGVTLKRRTRVTTRLGKPRTPPYPKMLGSFANVNDAHCPLL